MTPLRGWAPRGARLKAKAPFGHWKTMTFLAALRHDRIDAPWLLDGPVNSQSFLTYGLPPVSLDTEKRCFIRLEVGYAAADIQSRVQG